MERTKTTGEKIRELRKSMGLTQKQLAEKLGVTTTMISVYELDKRQPKPETIKRIANALNVNPAEIDGSLSDFLGGESTFTSDGKSVSVQAHTPEADALNILQVLNRKTSNEWLSLGRTLANFPENRKQQDQDLLIEKYG